MHTLKKRSVDDSCRLSRRHSLPPSSGRRTLGFFGTRSFHSLVCALLGLVVALWANAASASETVRLSLRAFDTDVEIEVRDLARVQAEPAIREALGEVHRLAELTDPEGKVAGGIGFLNAAAGAGPQSLDATVTDLLLSASRYCLWSSNAHGPLGGGLYRLWNAPSGAIPHPQELRQATEQAACGRLRFVGDAADRGVELAAGSRLLLQGFARGFAVDRAAEVLGRHGVANFWIEAGSVYRAAGGGADGAGWDLSIPAQPDNEDVTEHLKLQDQSLVVVSVFAIGDDEAVRWIDQRTGVPARGVLTQVTVSDNAFDAEMVATSLFIIGLRDGQRRLGSLEPRPSILWLLGDNRSGEPLVSTYRWSEVKHVKRRSFR